MCGHGQAKIGCGHRRSCSVDSVKMMSKKHKTNKMRCLRSAKELGYMNMCLD